MKKRTLIVLILILKVAVSIAQENYIDKFEGLQNKKVIAVGESAHGVKEFAEWNINLFKELVRNGVAQTFMLENDFSNTKQLNRYISESTYSSVLDSLMNENLNNIWQTKKMKEFLEWAKDYNAGKEENEKIKLIGFDSQKGNYAIKEILKFIDSNYPEFRNELSGKGLELLSQIKHNKNYNIKKLSKDEQQLMKSTLDNLNVLFTHKIDANESIQIDVLALNHAWEYENANPLNFTVIRDRNMATLFKEATKNETKPVFMWAHNGHINKSNTSFYKPIGFHLFKEYGTEYLAIGLDFKEIKDSKNNVAIKDSNWLANKIEFDNNDIQIIKTKGIGTYVIREASFSLQKKMKLKNDNEFDYIVYFRELKK
ncbi:erythromycin esterase family protein [Pontibacter qinzhouensis]|uniref:Erythromycin esterase family protein n=1 Tax=Pontibacter qinzhouensis TaxID=2603253 RepID=A0A5C8K0P2_9BACT|nr:erythromycin esterase family protein [Pontibacter qinzhouensis]TXK44145.1 erythromycin esterase family protein [Pontibacter qinzhouensis]